MSRSVESMCDDERRTDRDRSGQDEVNRNVRIKHGFSASSLILSTMLCVMLLKPNAAPGEVSIHEVGAETTLGFCFQDAYTDLASLARRHLGRHVHRQTFGRECKCRSR